MVEFTKEIRLKRLSQTLIHLLTYMPVHNEAVDIYMCVYIYNIYTLT